MTTVVRTGLSLVAATGVGALIVLGAMRIVERERTADEIDRLRDELYRARVTADRCRGSLLNSEASLRSLGLAIDSLKHLVDDYEGVDRRVVRGDQYAEYLEVFDEYNDSVEVWEGRERRLRSSETSCRETIGEHNALSDSLQTVLSEAGIATG